jgi:hypothetical protein
MLLKYVFNSYLGNEYVIAFKNFIYDTTTFDSLDAADAVMYFV